MAAQGLGPHGVWQHACPRQRCFSSRTAAPSGVARPGPSVPLVRAHASVESMPRKTRPGEKKGVLALPRIACPRGLRCGVDQSGWRAQLSVVVHVQGSLRKCGS